MKKLLGILAVIYIGVALATDISYSYTAKVYVSTSNLNASVVFDQPAMLVDIKNTSNNDIQFACNCPDGSIFTNLYTNNICGIITSQETKRIQIQNYPVKRIDLHAVSGTSNLLYITGM